MTGRAALIALGMLALPGCYTDVIANGTAPIGHGHGNAGMDLYVAIGSEHSDPGRVYGAGVLTGMHFAEGHTFGAFAFHARGAYSFSRDRYGESRPMGPMLTGHVAFGFGCGLPDDRDIEGPTGLMGQAFAGVGLGGPHTRAYSYTSRGYVAVGPVVNWFSPFAHESAVWMIGVGLEMSTAIPETSPIRPRDL